MERADNLSASLEDYLEAIYRLVEERKVARVTSIATRLKVHKSSVTGALRALAGRGLVNYQPYGLVTLTEEGVVAARDIVRRHEALSGFFTCVLGLDEMEAETAACRMEHAVPRRVTDRLIHFGEFLSESEADDGATVKQFQKYCRAAHPPQK
ncbi:MAG TPA: metal-dependent transcriptional regulator [Candidatus Brocadiia bacterium]|nr:metal-dependent transcriptional regulator [Candidatus Brocadiia bacterium]